MNSIQFTVLGEPYGKGRPRFNRFTGTAHTPEKTESREALVGYEYRRQCGAFRFPDTAMLDMRILAYYSVPKGDSKATRAAKLEGFIRPTKKPDMDNVVKLVADALNQVAYRDDTQIVDCQCRKFYSEQPRTVIIIKQIGKENEHKPLLWFVGALMENYPGDHLCIGSYLSTWLFNYVMSYVLRYAMSLAQCRRGVRTAYVKAIVCYADDFSLFGFYSQLVKVIRKSTKWAKDHLGINIKPAWQIYRPDTFEEEKEVHRERAAGSHRRTEGVDMMGFVIRRTYTIIRGRIFLRIRKQVLRAWNDIKRLGYLPWWRACRITAYKGWVKFSDSVKFAAAYRFYPLLKLARQSVSTHGRKEYVKNEQRILLVAASGC